MHVLAATTIEEGHEMFLSYVSPLFSTPMRQVSDRPCSSEIKCLCFMEWPSEILQNLPYSGIRIDDWEFEMLILVFI